MNDFLSFVGMVIVPFVLLGAALFGSLHFYGKYQCQNYAAISGKETRWADFDTCYIKSGNEWMRWDEYKVRFMAYDGMKK